MKILRPPPTAAFHTENVEMTESRGLPLAMSSKIGAGALALAETMSDNAFS
jgi:hypothetical protein